MHYRKPIDFSWTKLAVAKKTIARLDRFVDKLRACQNGPVTEEINQRIYDLKQQFVSAMDDDLNIAHALAALFRFIHAVNRIMDSQGLAPSDEKKVGGILSRLNSMLMIMDLEEPESSQKIEHLLQERAAARQKKEWSKADHIRNQLKKLGVEVLDTGESTTWRRVGS
jgi:cysteinyl-tRNA synthetase